MVITALESDAGMESNDRNFIFEVCVAVLLNTVDNEVGILGFFCSAFGLTVFSDNTIFYCYVSRFPKIAQHPLAVPRYIPCPWNF